MNKVEILEKSRAEKSDEGLLFAENRGRILGKTAFCLIFIAIVLFNFFRGDNNYAPMAMFWAFIAAEAYPKYQFTRNKAFLVTAIAGSIASLASFLNFILAAMR